MSCKFYIGAHQCVAIVTLVLKASDITQSVKNEISSDACLAVSLPATYKEYLNSSSFQHVRLKIESCVL